MKKIILFVLLTIPFLSKAQFPGTDSLRNFNNRFITNEAMRAFTNLRLHNLLSGIIDFIDSSRGGSSVSLGVDTMYVTADSIFHYRKNGVFRQFVIRGQQGARRIYEVPFSNGAGKFDADSNFTFDKSQGNNNTRLIIGPTAVNDGGLSKLNATSDNMNAAAFTAFGSGTNTIIFRRALGTVGLPLAITDGTDLWNFSGRGYTGSVYTTSRANIYARTTQNWTDTTHGTKIVLGTTHNDSSVMRDRMTIDHDGRLYLHNYKNLEQTIDTTYKKIITIDSNGKVWQFAGWPGSSGGSNYYNIIDYGAVGDGVTDNTTAINNAIADAATTKGIVFIPPGQWGVRVSYRDTAVAYKPRGIILSSNVTIVGAGIGKSIIKVLPLTGATFTMTCSQCVCTFPCYTTNSRFTDVIHGTNVSNVILKDFSINGNRDEQVNYTLNPYSTPWSVYTWGDTIATSGVVFRHGDNNRVYNLRVDSMPAHGIVLDSSVNSKVEGCGFTANINGSVMYWGPCDGGTMEKCKSVYEHCDPIRVKSSNITISNNEIGYTLINPEAGLNNFAGIYVESGTSVGQITGVKIINNHTYDNSAFGIDLYAPDTTDITSGPMATIKGNIIEYNGNGGIEVAAPNVLIENNHIYNNGRRRDGFSDPQFSRPYGINLNTSFVPKVSNIIISGNIMKETRATVYQTYALGNGGSGSTPALTFTDNSIEGGVAIFQPSVINTSLPASTVDNNTFTLQNVEQETVSYKYGTAKVFTSQNYQGITIGGSGMPSLRFANNSGADKGLIGIQEGTALFSNGTADDLNIYSGPSEKILVGTSGNADNSSELEISSGNVKALADIVTLNNVGIGSYSMPNISSGWGGTSQRTKLYLTQNESGKYPSIVIQAPTNGGGSLQFTDDANVATASVSVDHSGGSFALYNGKSGWPTTFYNTASNSTTLSMQLDSAGKLYLEKIDSTGSPTNIMYRDPNTHKVTLAAYPSTLAFYKGSTTWQPGIVAAGSSATTTLTVTGAATTDVVHVNKVTGGLSNGEIYDAWVSASNTVTIRVHNVSTGSANYNTTETYNVVLLKY